MSQYVLASPRLLKGTKLNNDQNTPVELSPELHAELRQTQVEFDRFEHAKAALCACLDREIEGDLISRKLLGLQNSFRVFADRLIRTFSIEEHGGLAELLIENPNNNSRGKELVSEHSTLFCDAQQISTMLEHCSPDDSEEFDRIQLQIHEYLTDIRRHTEKEAELLMDAFNTDIGVGD